MMKQISSKRHGLVKAIEKFFPSQFFGHLEASKKTTLWMPQRIVFFGILMTGRARTLGNLGRLAP
jgi:hypothetical protein